MYGQKFWVFRLKLLLGDKAHLRIIHYVSIDQIITSRYLVYTPFTDMRNFSGTVVWYSADRMSGMLAWS